MLLLLLILLYHPAARAQWGYSSRAPLHTQYLLAQRSQEELGTDYGYVDAYSVESGGETKSSKHEDSGESGHMGSEGDSSKIKSFISSVKLFGVG